MWFVGNMLVIAVCVLCIFQSVSATKVFVPREVIGELGRRVTFPVTFSPYNESDEAVIKIAKANGLKSAILSATVNFTIEPEVKLSSFWTNRGKVEVSNRHGVVISLSDVAVSDEGEYEVDVRVNNITTLHKMHIEAIARPTSSLISISRNQAGTYKEGDVVNITCSGVAGRPLGNVNIVRRQGSPVFSIVQAPLLLRNYSLVYNGSYIVDYTFSHVMSRKDNGTDLSCEIVPGSPSLSKHMTSRSQWQPIVVECK